MSALPILDMTENTFRILKENFNSVLTKVGQRPFVLFSVNGATRTGKSYALNYFIRYLQHVSGQNDQTPHHGNERQGPWHSRNLASVFEFRGGRGRTTTGINLWSEPFIVQVDGKSSTEIAILLMDCQGLFDEMTTARQNAIIFSLSSLCSSVSIFNLMKNVDESVLQKLQFFAGYAHMVSSSDSDGGSRGRVDEAFQKLVFLVRDFDFQGYEYGYHDMKTTNPPSPNNFCTDLFNLSQSSRYEGNQQRPMENIFVREAILNSYRDVGVFLMPNPGQKFVRKNETADDDFVANMVAFVELMHSSPHLLTKRIGGQEVTGVDFRSCIDGWARLCEHADQHFPAVQTVLQSTAIIQNTLACNTANSFYDKESQAFFDRKPAGVSDPEYVAMHDHLKKRAIEVFDKIKKLGSAEVEDEYRTALVENVDKIFEGNRKFNQILQSKAATEKEMIRQKENLNKLQQQLVELNGKSKEEQDRLQTQIQMGERKLQTMTKESVAAQNALKADIQTTKANFAKIVQEQELAKQTLLVQVNETKKICADNERKFEQVQTQHRQEIRSIQEETQHAIARSQQRGGSGGFFSFIGKALDCIVRFK